MILMIPLAKVGIDQPQTSILRLSVEPDVLQPHNPCFCQETYQPGTIPGQEQW